MQSEPPIHPDAGSPASAASEAATSAPGRVVLDDVAIRRALMRIAHEVVERNDDLDRLYLVGVPNGGVPLARRLAKSLHEVADLEPVVGILDTTLYRDDVLTSGERPRLRVTEMPSAVDEQIVILVDDVCSTGRTIRAAMDALMDFGRPRAVQVVALVDRGHRELPIKIDYVGKNIPTRSEDRVKMRPGREEGLLEVALIEAAGESERGEAS
ncbi:MAG: bifunctional pyr operon transcriptional regulator/uracil phosphoribosyltransferase PyrR [Myxococcota bacterium]|nr:bifunctional pyr operon transcriptional regulator/uracil phosphoribosyltransferase PyrR [Myxococcota bacterium]